MSHLFDPDDLHRGSGDPLSDRVIVSRVCQAVTAVLRSLTPADGNPVDGDRFHRQSEIIRRCVIGTEPYKAVASDLAISLRTLFRDLDGIRLRLVTELPRYTPPAATAAVASDTFELELRHAHVLRNMGRFDEALAVLQRLVSDAVTPLQRARAWNSSAVTLVDAGSTDKASQAVERARITLAGADVEVATTRTLIGCDVDLTDAMIARVKGDTACAIDRYGRAANLSRPLLPDAPESATDVYVRAESKAAVIEWLTGRVNKSSEAVERGWDALERINDPPETAHYSLLAASALVRLVANGDVVWAIREMSAAAVLAERHGMLHDALMALGWLAGLERINGDIPNSVETSRRTIAIARNTMTGTEFALLCAAAAENEAEFGNAAGAIGLIEEARAHVLPGGSAWARLHLAEAFALLAMGRYGDAIFAAVAGADGMQRQGKAGFVGTAYLIKALAHERRGELPQALLASREALPLLERFGKSPELVRAYDLSAHLTGNRGHQMNAVDLGKLLKG